MRWDVEQGPISQALEHVVWPAVSVLMLMLTTLGGAFAWLFNLSGRLRSMEDRQIYLIAWLERIEKKLDNALVCPIASRD